MSFKTKMKKFVKDWLLPPMALYFFTNWVLRIRHFSTLRKLDKKSRRLFVLATGPSFNEDLKRYKESIQTEDAVAMNMFATSPLFAELHPRLYLLVDPLWFKPAEFMEKSTFKDNYINLRNALISGVSWEMSLIVPDSAYDSDLIKSLKSNTNIKIFYYNCRVSMKGSLGLWFMKKGWTSPPAQTVANVAAGLGVVAGYEEVWMLGIDTSMHTMMRVDQKTNEMYLENQHFYGTKKEKGYRGADKSQAYTVAFFLGCAVKMFEGYERIRELADYCGVKVINASSFSWVDSLERPNI